MVLSSDHRDYGGSGLVSPGELSVLRERNAPPNETVSPLCVDGGDAICNEGSGLPTDCWPSSLGRGMIRLMDQVERP